MTCKQCDAHLLDRASQAEQALATVTAERNEAKYWLAAHKAASEALVDPVTGHGFFMLIGKGDDGADGWFYTFGGPLDSYTLCERSDDEDPHFVYFQRERYDHDCGCWIDGCEVVEPVLAPDECSVAPYCLEDVTEERDTLKRERDEARHALMGVAKVLRAPDGFAHAHLPELAADTIEQLNQLAGDGKEVAIILALTEERDALKAKLAEVERERDAEVNAHDKLDDLAVAYARERDEARAALASVRKERDELDEKYTAACDDVAWRQAKVGDLTRALADADKHADDLTATVERAREVARLDRDAATKANDTAKRYQTERDAAVAREAQWERLARELSGEHGGLGDFREWCAQLKCDYDVECGVRSQREGEIAALRSRGGGNCGCRLLFPNEMGKISRPDPQAPATRAELEELRRRVERLEQLTGFAPKE